MAHSIFSLFPLPHLLQCTSSEGCGVQEALQVSLDGAEVGISTDTGNKVIIAPFLFHNCSCLLGKDSYLLMTILQRENSQQNVTDTHYRPTVNWCTEQGKTSETTAPCESETARAWPVSVMPNLFAWWAGSSWCFWSSAGMVGTIGRGEVRPVPAHSADERGLTWLCGEERGFGPALGELGAWPGPSGR